MPRVPKPFRALQNIPAKEWIFWGVWGTLICAALVRWYAVGLWETVGHVIPHHVFQLPGHYLVVEVPDGDSIVILAGDRYESVQMRNIQTPNRNKPGYAQAGAYLRERILDETIQLEFEEEQPRRDFFGRYVAYVVHEGQVMNIEMVRQGFSVFEEEAGESQYAELFQEAEAQARVDKLGRWSTPPFANPPKSVLE